MKKIFESDEEIEIPKSTIQLNQAVDSSDSEPEMVTYETGKKIMLTQKKRERDARVKLKRNEKEKRKRIEDRNIEQKKLKQNIDIPTTPLPIDLLNEIPEELPQMVHGCDVTNDYKKKKNKVCKLEAVVGPLKVMVLNNNRCVSNFTSFKQKHLYGDRIKRRKKIL
jgi:hypothetical protein